MRNTSGDKLGEAGDAGSQARGLEQSKSKSAKEIELGATPDKATRHVLVVEDDPIILELLQDVLNSAGFKVLIAKNAPDGLAMFENYVESTVCVILDYGIPGMHASRLLERMQDIDENVKVILSSGYPQNFIREDFPVEQLAGFMAKPYDPQVLISELKKLTR